MIRETSDFMVTQSIGLQKPMGPPSAAGVLRRHPGPLNSVCHTNDFVKINRKVRHLFPSTLAEILPPPSWASDGEEPVL